MWVVKLTDKQLEVLRAMLRAEEHLGPALQRCAGGAGPGAVGRAPGRAAAVGRSVADEARRQGISEADVVWDLCGRTRSPPPHGAAASLGASARR